MNSFRELLQSGKPVLVDFSAEWCGPCQMMPPILKELKTAMGDKVTIVKIDIDKNPDLSRQFAVQSVPTLMLFQDSQVKWRQSGVIPAKQIQQILEQKMG
jgi:thioredoxin 1